MRFVCACALGAMLAATPGVAFGQSTEGFRVEAHIGYDNIPTYDVPAARRTGGDGLLFGGGLGYDFDLNGFVIGPELNLNFTTADAKFSGPPTQFLTGTEGGRDIELSLRAGYRVGGTTLLYVKGGYDNARFKETTTQGTFRGNNDGWRLGAGLEQPIAGKSYVKLEYRYTNYGELFAFGNDSQTRHQAVAGVGLRF